MHELISDIIGFLKTLNQIDFLLYIAVLFLVILVVSLIYIVKNGEEEEITESTNEFDIKETVSNLENNNPEIINYTPYEEEQEQKAIISYDELIAQNQKKENLTEKIIPHNEISIKKIDLTKEPEIPNLPRKVNEIKEEEPLNDNSNYQKEEIYLKNLKTFLNLLK